MDASPNLLSRLPAFAGKVGAAVAAWWRGDNIWPPQRQDIVNAKTWILEAIQGDAEGAQRVLDGGGERHGEAAVRAAVSEPAWLVPGMPNHLDFPPRSPGSGGP